MICLDLRVFNAPQYGMAKSDNTERRSFFDDLRAQTIRYRKNTKLNQEMLGARLGGLGQTAISDFENGKTLLNEEALEELLFILSTPVAKAANKLRNLADDIEMEESTEGIAERLNTFINSFTRGGRPEVNEDRIGGG